MKNKALFIPCILLFLCLLLDTCKPRDEVITSQTGLHLGFGGDIEGDTVLFDTVFTEQITITKRLTVYNPYSNAVTISQIRLGGNGSSSYSLIINGLKGSEQHNVFLLGKDSLYILIKADINTKNTLLPFIVNDSILFSLNGSSQKIYLTAWGRNAHYYKGDTLTGSTVWDSSQVRFIYKTVFVPKGSQLTIQPGTIIKATKGAGIVVEGKLVASGDTNKAVLFDGPSIDKNFIDEAGQWSGISFLPGSTGNIINRAIIRNAETGITLGNDQNKGNSDLLLTNTILKNFSGSGVQVNNAQLTMYNCVVTNCIDYGIKGLLGGNYIIYNNTIANYSNNYTRNGVSLYLSNSKVTDNSVSNPISADIENNIIWGSQSTELTLGNRHASSWTSLILLRNIIKSNDSIMINDTSDIYNLNPQFTDSLKYNFTIDSVSPAIGKGLRINLFNNDIKGKARGSKYDIGAYQH